MGHSPDAFAQMAIQLAAYRLFGKQVGTYEASQMRPYLHGRTETTRSVSKESSEFVKRMGMMASFDDTQPSLEAKRLLLRKATKSHTAYISKAAKGEAVDRHLFGISMLANNEDNIPSLYMDPLFVRSKRWRLGTSNLMHPNVENWGFGEVVRDGLGIGVGYSVKPNSCIFNICARKEHRCTVKFSHLLEEALLEMRALSDIGSPESKL
jgi:carnitine O-acetyltransferase